MENLSGGSNSQVSVNPRLGFNAELHRNTLATLPLNVQQVKHLLNTQSFIPRLPHSPTQSFCSSGGNKCAKAFLLMTLLPAARSRPLATAPVQKATLCFESERLGTNQQIIRGLVCFPKLEGPRKKCVRKINFLNVTEIGGNKGCCKKWAINCDSLRFWLILIEEPPS